MKNRNIGLAVVLALVAVLLVVGVAFAGKVEPAATTKTRTSCHTHVVGGVNQFKFCVTTTFDWQDSPSNGVKPTVCTRSFQAYVSGWTGSQRQTWCRESYYATSGEHMKDWGFYKNGVYKGYLAFWHTAQNANEGTITMKFADGLP